MGLSECTMMMFGVPVGYSSPNTMTDMSTKVKRGQKGDASVLKPTMMCVVPLILDRIYKNIIDSVNKRGTNFQKAFEFCYRYKLYWSRNNKATPVVDKIVFNKIKSLLGGRMRFAIAGMEIKMVNWEEGHYRVTDNPRPRGEIIIGGNTVAKGYFKNDQKTEEDFYNEGGKRWFRTGDIGELFDDGTVRIIDRKKDLVKLQLGEYVSLGKVESQL